MSPRRGATVTAEDTALDRSREGKGPALTSARNGAPSQDDEDKNCADFCTDGGLPHLATSFSDRTCQAGSSNELEGICSGCR